MLNEKDGLFKRDDKLIFNQDVGGSEALKILCDSFNKNKEVAGLLKRVGGDATVYTPDYSTPSIFGVLSFAKLLLINLRKCVDLKIKKEGVIRRTILSNIPFSDQIKKRIEKLPLDTTAEDIFNCFKARNNSVRGLRFYSYSKSKYDPYSGIYINARKIYKILCAMEKVGSDDYSLKIIGNAIKEIDEVLNTMLSNQCVGIVYLRSEAKEEVKEADAMATLTINRPSKQQENKIITVGNKKAYQVGKGDYQHRNGVIKEEKAEMNRVYTYPVGDKNILADLEDLLNNIIDNPDTVDNLVNYLEKNAPAAHFISEMIGCGEVDSEESLIGAFNKATSLSQGMVCAGKNVRVQGGEYKVFNYLNIDYPKPIFGREFSLKQLSFCFDVAAREVEDILNSAKEEENEEVIANDAVQEHAEEDAAACDEYPTDLAELEKLLEERRKEVADLTVEVKQAEEDKRRRELINELIALDKQKAELNARKAELNKK